MNRMTSLSTAARPVFATEERARFARHYPERPHMLAHGLAEHPLLELEALAELGEALPDASVEYNRGDLPVGIDAAEVPSNGLGIGETIRGIAETGSWAVLKNVEQVPAYRALLLDLLGELRGDIEAATGPMLTPQAYVFISSPGSMTPFHFDPEHNILLQLRGSKTMTQFPAGDVRYAPNEAHEAYHTGSHRNLVWREDMRPGGTAFELAPGDAVYVPVMAPHFVRNGSEPSISLSITWRSEWSYGEADARAFNRWLRRHGLRPGATNRFPGSNPVRANAYRLLRKTGLNRI